MEINVPEPHRFIRADAVVDYFGLRGKSSLYDRVRDSTLPPPIKLSSRLSVWPEHEIAAISSAILHGTDTKKIRELVRELVAARGESAEQIELRETAKDKARASLCAQ